MTISRRAVVSVATSGDPLADGVLSGVAWVGGTIHYAFPDKASDYGKNYDTGEPQHNFHPFNAALKQNALFILEQDHGTKIDDAFSVEGFTKLNSRPAATRRRKSAMLFLPQPTRRPMHICPRRWRKAVMSGSARRKRAT